VSRTEGGIKFGEELQAKYNPIPRIAAEVDQSRKRTPQKR
jgi:hypothetical protein